MFTSFNNVCKTKHCFLIQDKDSPWVWIDGTQVEYENWNVNEPSFGENAEYCAYILTNGRWDDNTCEYQKHPFICEIKKGENFDYIHGILF